MRKTELQRTMEKPTIAYWSVFPGVEVKDVHDDKIELLYGTMTPSPRRKLLKIHYTPKTDRAYIIIDASYRLYLDECIRT